MKKIINSNFGKFILTPFLLLALWLFLTFVNIVTYDTSFSVWSYNHPDSVFSEITYEKLKKGDKISGYFDAKDKNLGILAVRFQTYIKPPYLLEDEIQFRIREKGSRGWYYESIYRNGLIYEVPFFPFGFPQISDSRGKTYEFEIVSLNGNSKNSASISNRFPTIVSKYKYSKQELLEDKGLFKDFLIKKIYNSMLNPDIWFSSLIYLLPLLFYIAYQVWKYTRPKLLKKLKFISIRISSTNSYEKFHPILLILNKIFVSNLSTVLIFIILIDIIVIQLRNDFVYIVICYLWYLSIKIKNKNINFTLRMTLIFLILAPILSLLNSFSASEKAGVWAFLFLVIWTVQLIIRYRGSNFSKNDSL